MFQLLSFRNRHGALDAFHGDGFFVGDAPAGAAWSLGLGAVVIYKMQMLWAQLDALHYSYCEPGLIPPGVFVPKDLFMKERLLIKNETIPIIPDYIVFQYSKVRKEWVLNAPERTLYPCKIAVEVLKKCNGNLNIEKIAEELATLYKAPIKKISKDIKISSKDKIPNINDQYKRKKQLYLLP